MSEENNIGSNYKLQGDVELALDYYKKSLKIEEKIGSHDGIATSLSNIGIIYFRQGEYEKAIPFYLKAFPITPIIYREKKMLEIKYSNTTTAIQLDEPNYIKQQPNTQVLVKDNSQNSLASLALFGTGKIVATTLNNTYTLQLQNKH